MKAYQVALQAKGKEIKVLFPRVCLSTPRGLPIHRPHLNPHWPIKLKWIWKLEYSFMNAATAESCVFHQSRVYQRFDDQHIAFAAADKNHSFLAPPSFLPLGVWLPQEYYPPDQEDQLPHWYIEWVDKGCEVTKLTFQVLPLHRSSCLTLSHMTEHQFH